MELKLTTDVQNYRLVTPYGQSAFLLQRPPTVEGWDSDEVLVREDGASKKNAVSFKKLENLAAVDEGCHTTHVHGILRQSDPGQGYQEGDQVWLRAQVWKRALNRDNQDKIEVVNLRTWKDLVVPLGRVLWVPTHRRLGRDGAEEELITLAGPLKKRLCANTYTLAVVQRVRRHELKVEVRELLEKETFTHDCQNLRRMPGGNAITEEICRRVLAVQDHMSLVHATASTGTSIDTRTHSSARWREMNVATALATPPRSLYSSSSAEDDGDDDEDDGDDEEELEQSVQEMQNLVEARVRRSSPRVRRPYQKCNFPRGQCPTPAIFFNRPEYTSELRAHYHVPDDWCALGPAHELHCVYRYANDRRRDCLLGSNVQHACCVRGEGGGPGGNNRRRKICRPLTILSVPSSSTIERDGRGAIRMVEGGRGQGGGGDGQGGAEAVELFVDLPFKTVPMVPDFTRDLDSLGDRDYGVGERTDLVGREWVLGRENVFGEGMIMLTPPGMTTSSWSPLGNAQQNLGAEQGVVGGGGVGVDDSGDGADAFADRHLDLNEYEDGDGDGVDVFADRREGMGHYGNGEYGTGNYFGGFMAQSHGLLASPQVWGHGEQMELDAAGWLTGAENW